MNPWFGELIRASARARAQRLHAWLAPTRSPPAPGPDGGSPALRRMARDDLDRLFVRLGSSAHGLSRSQAERARERHGPNEVDTREPWAWLRAWWRSYAHPFNLLLTVIGVLSWLKGEVAVTGIIFTMVALATLLRWTQERRSERTLHSLRHLVRLNATVLRPSPHGDGPVEQRVPARDLVPSDVVVLAAGDQVPADCRLLDERDCHVNQSALSGEALPVRKRVIVPGGGGDDLLALEHMLYQGTSVVSGKAWAMVVATGRDTLLGRFSAPARRHGRLPTAFEAGSDQVSWLMIRFALVLLALVLLISGLRTGDWGAALLFAMAVAVGLTPELLPMIVTATLARGARVLAQRQVVIKRLDAVQNLGAMRVLCADKTGTLTAGIMRVQPGVDALGRPSSEPLYWAASHARLQAGTRHLIDQTLLSDAHALSLLTARGVPAKLDELPFDAERRRASVALQDPQGQRWLVCKGAVEEVVALCDRYAHDGYTLPWDLASRRRMRELTRDWSRQGLRVIAVARRPLGADEALHPGKEKDLTLLGFLAFADPVKPGAREAMARLRERGVDVRILTGDNEWVAQSVCEQLGLPVRGVTTGKRIDRMSDAQLQRVCAHTTVFARLTPLHKQRVVMALRQQGSVVGYMGDGVNDAAALISSDVGLSFKEGVDAAREAADVILLQRDLRVLHDGVVQGRITFANMLKYIRMATSSNLGNAVSVVAASALLPFLPMLPLHLLAQNLLYSLSQLAIPFDHVDPALTREPVQWNAPGIGRFMLTFGPLSSVFDLLTFAFLWWGLGLMTLADQASFHAGWFVVGLLSQLMVVHIIRTPGRPFLDSRPSLALGLATLAAGLGGLWLVLGPLAGPMQFGALPLDYALWVGGLLLAYAFAAQALKRWYARRYGWM